MAKLLMPLVLLMLCCCLVPGDGCNCRGKFKKPIPARIIKKIEMIPVSGHCRWPEIILTRRNGSKVCIDPNQQWFKLLLGEFRAQSGSDVTQNSMTNPDNFR